jgi:hypothetical protein
VRRYIGNLSDTTDLFGIPNPITGVPKLP